ncbi:hypothetical protein NHH03_02400 [Stieleria sp. TO1_6]|uniref:hypothetical protein n=1 Tax=Stieleria tagensis TaxID=2956795 RepID=UPI00209B6F7B|nr:hypothetical protein [Stieleria tagensis]MCO8120574.1 hypothetical protein [Stieleria tagensis]
MIRRLAVFRSTKLPKQLAAWGLLGFFSGVFGPSTLCAQDASTVSGDQAPRQIKLETLLPMHLASAQEYEFQIESTPPRNLVLQQTPISQWTNMRRSAGQLGHVFVWMDGEEPAVLGTIFSFPWKGELTQRRIVHELHALSPDKLTVSRRAPGVVWQPESGLVRSELPGVQSAITNLARFKIQTRQIVRRFSGHCVGRDGQRWELRVLPTPLMFYPINRPTGSGFGAVVGMMGDVGSDLESGFLIEAVLEPDNQTPQWMFAPIRLTDMETHLQFDRQPIWDSVRSETDTIFHDTPKTYFRFQDKTVPLGAELSDNN